MLYDKYEERHCKERDSQKKVKRVKKTISSLNLLDFQWAIIKQIHLEDASSVKGGV